MDDFQFKPLTEGLGFHKRNREKSGLLDLSKNSEASEDFDLTMPLPRQERHLPSFGRDLSAPHSTVDEILKTLNSSRNLDFQDPQNEKQSLLNKNLQIRTNNTPVELSAGLLDSMLIIAMSLLCMIVTLVITKIDLAANILNPDSENMVYFALIGLVSGMSWIYLTLTRAFMGFTPGEWVFDQRLGTLDEMKKGSYIPLVGLRSLLNLATGFVTLPLISAIFRTDVCGLITGLRLKKVTHG